MKKTKATRAARGAAKKTKVAGKKPATKTARKAGATRRAPARKAKRAKSA